MKEQLPRFRPTDNIAYEIIVDAVVNPPLAQVAPWACSPDDAARPSFAQHVFLRVDGVKYVYFNKSSFWKTLQPGRVYRLMRTYDRARKRHTWHEIL